ncbi:Uncharacterized protein dnm_077360 [Desulfonema magnum]|uniref:Uncharacterized protein n=1 Tax=Desulfonema magnum TaxID=45655 RepID=A0A975GT20_9BACT|nr:Uncharacterized protein dnm_077360 [Desulfonema magnum]
MKFSVCSDNINFISQKNREGQKMQTDIIIFYVISYNLFKK